MPEVTPFLWFDGNAEEAMDLYTSIFKDAKVLNVSRGPDGKLFTGTFELAGRQYMVLNGGPHFRLNEAFSLFVSVETQEEVDYYWEKLTEGGEESQCGWLKDRFGLSWQIVPAALGELLGSPDRAAADRAMQAMLTMRKLDIQQLRDAFAGEG
jgi:predicted 3-demethylubiquinone-9 3-methyltransferase (glyoxalase superfamily)